MAQLCDYNLTDILNMIQQIDTATTNVVIGELQKLEAWKSFVD